MERKDVIYRLAWVGLAISTTIFTVRVYRIVKAYREAEKSADNLMAEINAIRALTKLQDKVTPVVEEKPVESTYEPPKGRDDEEYRKEKYSGIPFNHKEDGYEEEKEMEELRFPPNSKEALHQYKEMRTAEFDSASHTKKMLLRLFNFKYEPVSEADGNIGMYIQEARHEFFGSGAHIDDVTVAELILYFAGLLDFDLDGGVEYWTDRILWNLGLDGMVPQGAMKSRIDFLMRHMYHGRPNTFGLFGLNDTQVNGLKAVHGPTGLTFMMQYHVFLQHELNIGNGPNHEAQPLYSGDRVEYGDEEEEY